MYIYTSPFQRSQDVHTCDAALQSQGGDIMEVTICMHMDGQAHMYACTHMVFVVKYAYTSAVSTWPCTCTYIGTLGSIT
jgi:hypothetical protein